MKIPPFSLPDPANTMRKKLMLPSKKRKDEKRMNVLRGMETINREQHEYPLSMHEKYDHHQKDNEDLPRRQNFFEDSYHINENMDIIQDDDDDFESDGSVITQGLDAEVAKCNINNGNINYTPTFGDPSTSKSIGFSSDDNESSDCEQSADSLGTLLNLPDTNAPKPKIDSPKPKIDSPKQKNDSPKQKNDNDLDVTNFLDSEDEDIDILNNVNLNDDGFQDGDIHLNEGDVCHIDNESNGNRLGVEETKSNVIDNEGSAGIVSVTRKDDCHLNDVQTRYLMEPRWTSIDALRINQNNDDGIKGTKHCYKLLSDPAWQEDFDKSGNKNKEKLKQHDSDNIPLRFQHSIHNINEVHISEDEDGHFNKKYNVEQRRKIIENENERRLKYDLPLREDVFAKIKKSNKQKKAKKRIADKRSIRSEKEPSRRRRRLNDQCKQLKRSNKSAKNKKHSREVLHERKSNLNNVLQKGDCNGDKICGSYTMPTEAMDRLRVHGGRYLAKVRHYKRKQNHMFVPTNLEKEQNNGRCMDDDIICDECDGIILTSANVWWVCKQCKYHDICGHCACVSDDDF